MDDLLAILIPAIPNIPGLEKRQAVYSWGGQEYPQEPITFHWGPYVAFRTSQLQEYLWKFLPEEYRHTNWLVLDVNEKALDMLEREVNGKEVDWDGWDIEAVLRQILSLQERWVLVFEPHYDQMDSVYHLPVTECLEKLKLNYRRDQQKEGFICVGDTTQRRIGGG